MSSMGNKKPRTAEYVTAAIPLAYKYPTSPKIFRMANSKELTIEDRKEGWTQKKTPRKTGQEDTDYRHLKSSTKCRSLREVYDYIITGIPKSVKNQLPETQKDASSSKPKTIRGSSLLQTIIIGSYNLQTETISLHEKPEEAVECRPQRGSKRKPSTSASRTDGEVIPFVKFEFRSNC